MEEKVVNQLAIAPLKIFFEEIGMKVDLDSAEFVSSITVLNAASKLVLALKSANKKLDSEVVEKEIAPKMCSRHSNLIQVQASNAEINRRIDSFISRKRALNDFNNKREFCQGFSEESCARTNASFFKRSDCSSHFQVTRVVNFESSKKAKTESKSDVKSMRSSVINERLLNMEEHLNMQAPGAFDFSSVDFHSRLKALEERILFLESLSPEYFERLSNSELVGSEGTENLTIAEIDQKIHQLKCSLLASSSRICS